MFNKIYEDINQDKLIFLKKNIGRGTKTTRTRETTIYRRHKGQLIKNLVYLFLSKVMKLSLEHFGQLFNFLAA